MLLFALVGSTMAKDHYVPQCYLRNFKTEPGRIWCYEVGRYTCLMGIKKAASRLDYYTLKKEIHGIDSTTLDDLYKNIETHSSPIIQRLIVMEELDLSDDDRSMMALFVASLANRTPAFEDNQARMYEEILNHFNRMVTSNKDRFLAVASQAGIDVGNEDPEELEKTRLELMGGIKLDRERFKGPLQRTSVDIVFDGLAELLFHKEWHILHSDSSRVFITSDDPVVLLPPKDHHPADGLGFLAASILLTLSPKRALLLRNEPVQQRIIKINRDKVDFYNRAIMWHADKQMYSNLKSVDFEKAFIELQKNKERQKAARKGVTARE